MEEGLWCKYLDILVRVYFSYLIEQYELPYYHSVPDNKIHQQPDRRTYSFMMSVDMAEERGCLFVLLEDRMSGIVVSSQLLMFNSFAVNDLTKDHLFKDKYFSKTCYATYIIRCV